MLESNLFIYLLAACEQFYQIADGLSGLLHVVFVELVRKKQYRRKGDASVP